MIFQGSEGVAAAFLFAPETEAPLAGIWAVLIS
jgi:hypothetical protein